MEESHNNEDAPDNTEGTAKKAAAKRRPRAPRTRTVKKKAKPAGDATQEMALDVTPVEASPKPARSHRKPVVDEAPPQESAPAFEPPPPVEQSEPKRYTFEPTQREDVPAQTFEPSRDESSVEQSAPAQAEVPSSSPESQPAAENQGSASGDAAPTAPVSGQPTQQHQSPHQPHGQGQRPQHGQGNGGGAHDPHWKRDKFEKFDKRNKRNRGRHGDRPWQQGGPGGAGVGNGGQGGPQRPPQQPPPPELVPHYGDLPNPAGFTDLAMLDATAVEITSGGGEPVYLDKLYALTLAELNTEAGRLGVTFAGAPNRKQLLAEIFKQLIAAKRPILDRGWIDLTDKGHGFIVHEAVNYRLYPEDAYLPESLIFRYGLKRGHYVEALVHAPLPGERCPSVIRVDSVMGLAPDEISKVKPFEDLIPYYPLSRILLEAPEIHKDISMRAVDILTPIGFGQRGLIVAPPRTGKTVLLQNMANSISENFPDVKLILLLIDERPEEVTDFKRHTKGEVVSSTFDEAPESHVHCAEMVGEKARRLVEAGQHVVILLDSITRLARAYNALASNSGKIMSGGMEATALQKPKRFFGAARNIEGGGSLTIIATALIDTGSRMDEVIFEEFKGTGNMELHLDRGLVDKRIFPAINMDRSGTRKEELIYHPDEMLRIHGLRRAMQGIPPVEAMEMLITRLRKTKTNAEFLMSLNR